MIKHTSVLFVHYFKIRNSSGGLDGYMDVRTELEDGLL